MLLGLNLLDGATRRWKCVCVSHFDRMHNCDRQMDRQTASTTYCNSVSR